MPCSGSCDNSNSDSGPTSSPPPATPTSTPPYNFNSGGQAAATPQRDSITTSDVVCIVIATITMALHVILIILCGLNCLALKEIRKKLNPSIMPQSKSMSLAPAYNSNRNVSNETPADYDANPNAPTTTTIPTNYERTQQTPSPIAYQTYESIDGSKGDRSVKLRLQVPKHTSAGTDSPAWSRSENNSLNGSKIDLINHRV